MKWKTKPVVVNAIEWTGINLDEFALFFGDELTENMDVNKKTMELVFRVRDREFVVPFGGFVVRNGLEFKVVSQKDQVYPRSGR